MLQAVLLIGAGATAGAVVRWLLANSLNALFPSLPPGTLLANLLGGYLVGVALAVFTEHPELSPAWRLLVITGFLGGLTTFSAFSAEVALLIQQQRLIWATATVGAHVAGSVVMTLLGLATVAAWRRF